MAYFVYTHGILLVYPSSILIGYSLDIHCISFFYTHCILMVCPLDIHVIVCNKHTFSNYSPLCLQFKLQPIVSMLLTKERLRCLAASQNPGSTPSVSGPHPQAPAGAAQCSTTDGAQQTPPARCSIRGEEEKEKGQLGWVGHSVITHLHP